MKVSIRRGVFETNSSSSHALVLSNASADESNEEISNAIRRGLLDIDHEVHGGVFDTFIGKLAYLTSLKICQYCEMRDNGDYTVEDVKGCPEMAEWEDEVVARLAERGIRCDGLRYDSLVGNLNRLWGGLDHQVVEAGSDSVGRHITVDEKRWVRKNNYGWRELCGPGADGAKFENVDVSKMLNPPPTDIDVLFDDRLAIKYGWDSDEVYLDNYMDIAYRLEDVLAEAKAPKTSDEK